MSRLIVKNLPAYLDEGRLQSHFAARNPAITDVKILRRPDGTSRRFGFVGFKSLADAQDATNYFNRTFIDTARLDVSVAKAISDDELKAKAEQRKRRKDGVQGIIEASDAGPSSASNGDRKTPRDAPAKSAKSRNTKAITFDDFLEVMAPRSKRKTWQNEEAPGVVDYQPEADIVKIADEIHQSKKARKENAEAEAVKDNDEHMQSEEPAPDAAAADEGITDLEYMYKRMRRKVGEDLEEPKGFEQSDDEEEDGNAVVAEALAASELDSPATGAVTDEKEAHRQAKQKKRMEEKAKKDQDDVDTIMDSARLFVRNLPFASTEEELEGYFAQYGEVTQAHITLDKESKASKGIAFVSFQDPTHALAAFRAADGDTFQGRLLHVLPAVSQHAASKTPSTLKASHKNDLKTKSTKDFNWSTLYMSADAVASSVASRLKIDKADLLTEEGADGKTLSPAVRLALAETSIIHETKEYLESAGINMQAFEESSSSQRSDTVILVKNIPFGTSADMLSELFAKHGTVARVVMPPSGTIAVVEMDVAGEAKVAFKALAYKRLGNSIMYLEKAPLGVMDGTQKELDTMDTRAGQQTTNAVLAAQTAQSKEAPSERKLVDGESNATLFVKNLSFSTTDDRLAMAFSKLNGYAFARVQTRTTRRRDGKGEAKLSMGYGFVGFMNVAAARAAQKVMDKTNLDGHALSVDMAKRGHDANEAGAAGTTTGVSADGPAPGEEDIAKLAPSTKLIVKNLAFQASRRDVQALFSAHGKLKSVRVPKKGVASAGGGGTAAGVRGFAFVEFVSRREALNAYRALRHSHLLGRHLVLEWDTESGAAGASSSAGLGAETPTAVERLRQKTARGVAAATAAASGGLANRREKLRLGEEDIRKAAREEQRRQATSDDEDDEEDA